MLGSIFLTILIIAAIYFAYIFLKSGETPADVINSEEPAEPALVDNEKNDTKVEKLYSGKKFSAQNLFDWIKPRSIFSKSEEPRNPEEKTKYSFGDVEATNNNEKNKIFSDLGVKEKLEDNPGTNDNTKPIDKIKTKTNDEIGVNSIPITNLDRSPGDMEKDTQKKIQKSKNKSKNDIDNVNDPNTTKIYDIPNATLSTTSDIPIENQNIGDLKSTIPSASSAVKKKSPKKKLQKSSLESDLERVKKNYKTKKIDEESLMSADNKSDLFDKRERVNKSLGLGIKKNELNKSGKIRKNLLSGEKHLDIDTLIEKTKEHNNN